MRTLIGLALLLCSTAAMAEQIPCGDKDKILLGLKANYSEAPAFTGTISDTISMMVTVSDSGSWSVLIGSGGFMCIKAVGEDWKPSSPDTSPQPQRSLKPAQLPQGMIRIKE